MSDLLAQHRERFAARPDATASFEWLEEHYFLHEDWEPLAALYRARVAAPSLADEPTARGRLLLRLGQLIEERLGDDVGAIEAYRACAMLPATQHTAWPRLRRLYARRGAWPTVLQIAELEVAESEDPAQRARLYAEMGDVWQHHLGDAEQAEELYARARFERDAAAEVHAAQPEGDADPALVQSAWILAARGDSQQAVQVLRGALERDPSNIEAIDMLVTVLEGAERHGELADLLERRAALATDAETRAAVLARLGAVHETPLGDPSAARSAYERALGADPSHRQARESLMRLYRQIGDWNALRMLLESLVAIDAPETRLELLVALGQLLRTQFDEPNAAASWFEEALAIDPTHAPAREGLARVRNGAGAGTPAAAPEIGSAPAATDGDGESRASRVAGVLERKLAQLEATEVGLSDEAVKLRLRIAELRSSSLDDPQGGIALLEPCLEDETALLVVAERLSRLYASVGQHEAGQDLARRAAELCVDPEQRAAWYRRAAAIATQLGDEDAAALLLQRLLEARPGDRHAESALREYHRARGEAGPLVALLRSELARATQRDELPLHLEIGDLLDGALQDPVGALAHWRRALALDPARTDLLDRALRCAERAGGPLRQLDLIDHVAAAAFVKADRARLLARRGALMVDALGWRDEGVESWRRALELEPDQPELRERLQGLSPQPTA